MIRSIWKDVTFDAAHWLPNVAEGHQCGRLHGHTYHVRVEVVGELKEPQGWIVDLGDLKQILVESVAPLDHQCLNGIPRLENPTAEVIAELIADRVFARLPWGLKLASVEVQETPTSGARVTFP